MGTITPIVKGDTYALWASLRNNVQPARAMGLYWSA